MFIITFSHYPFHTLFFLNKHLRYLPGGMIQTFIFLFYFILFIFLAVLGMEPRARCVPSKTVPLSHTPASTELLKKIFSFLPTDRSHLRTLLAHSGRSGRIQTPLRLWKGRRGGWSVAQESQAASSVFPRDKGWPWHSPFDCPKPCSTRGGRN
jgi:hypothetical protein